MTAKQKIRNVLLLMMGMLVALTPMTNAVEFSNVVATTSFMKFQAPIVVRVTNESERTANLATFTLFNFLHFPEGERHITNLRPGQTKEVTFNNSPGVFGWGFMVMNQGVPVATLDVQILQGGGGPVVFNRAPSKPGDSNGDGSVDVADIRHLTLVISKEVEPSEGTNCNGDTVIDVADIRCTVLKIGGSQ